jgi:hypothetical protein
MDGPLLAHEDADAAGQQDYRGSAQRHNSAIYIRFLLCFAFAAAFFVLCCLLQSCDFAILAANMAIRHFLLLIPAHTSQHGFCLSVVIRVK